MSTTKNIPKYQSFAGLPIRERNLIKENLSKREHRASLINTQSLEFIFDEIVNYFNLPKEQIRSRSRKRQVVFPRQVFAYVAHHYTYSTLGLIGMYMGDRDHATALHATRTIESLIQVDHVICEIVKQIVRILQTKCYINEPVRTHNP